MTNSSESDDGIEPRPLTRKSLFATPERCVLEYADKEYTAYHVAILKEDVRAAYELLRRSIELRKSVAIQDFESMKREGFDEGVCRRALARRDELNNVLGDLRVAFDVFKKEAENGKD